MKPILISLFCLSLSKYDILIPIGYAIRCLTLVLLVLHYFPFSASLPSLATDTISLNQKVTDGQTIVSAGGVFELGFFGPTGPNNARFVGIWSKIYPNGKIVWVANREQPVTDPSGAFMIGPDGNLIITDGKHNTIWSTNVTLASNNTVAVLSDTGNLVLRENKSNGLVFWESFNNPSDTLMPGMKIGLNQRTGEQMSLISWKDVRDPSMGSFVALMDPQESPQIVIMNASVKHWRTGQWTGRSFIGIPSMIKDYRTGFSLNVDNQGGTMYFTYAPFNDSLLPLVYLGSTGNVIELDWDEEKSQWLATKLAPLGPCDIYGTCDAFGNCNNKESPICQCLRGYEPKSNSEWSKGNWTGGCLRRAKFQCERNTSSDKGKADGFFMFTGMKLPDFSHYVIADDITECQGICLQNCSCLACAFVDGLGCMLWGEDLIDLQKLPVGGEELHIRLAYSELDTGGKTKLRFLAILIVPVALLLIFMMYILRRRRNKGGGRGEGFIKKFILKKGLTTSKDNRAGFLLPDDISQGGSSEVPVFSLQSIEAATDKFSGANKLGQGGFGPVYKGRLPNGQEIAVKRLSRSSGQGIEEFKNEVILFSKLQHRNLVKLLGLCIQGEEKMLVYEYMPNKSLDSFIFGSGSTETAVLDWGIRYNIIEGIARGLLYLHRDSRLKIIHRDLKASNVLLDENMNPKIADFGMARIFGGDQSVANTNRVVGTYGYMPPEYAMQGIFSEKSDVFSFGVLLLEIISGKRNNGYHHYENPQNLLAYAWQLWDDGKALELLDSKMATSCNPTQVNRCIHVALLCVQEHANDRPIMSTVVSILSNDTSLASPKRPAFSSNEPPDISNLSPPKTSTCSNNYITVTTVDGR